MRTEGIWNGIPLYGTLELGPWKTKWPVRPPHKLGGVNEADEVSVWVSDARGRTHAHESTGSLAKLYFRKDRHATAVYAGKVDDTTTI